MPPEGQDRHPALRERSQRLLAESRQLAAKDCGYDSRKTRDAMDHAFKLNAGYNAYPWQLDVAEALLLKLDCLVIAGTGSGKTIPFILPLLLPENKLKLALIVSPLLSLQSEQAARFTRVKVRAVAVNHDTMNKILLAKLKDNQFQAVFAGPEMIMENEAFSRWMQSKATLARFLFVAVDEAHCIRLWGSDFRPHYHLLARLRSLLPTRVPVLATSATIIPDAELEICAMLEIDHDKAFYLNLGNDRPNISESVHLIKSSEDYDALLPFLPTPATPARHWPKTQIFVNTVMDAQVLYTFLLSKYDVAMHSRFDFIHSLRTPSARRRRLRRFRRGSIKVLISTEIGAMGQDIPDIVQVIQCGAPESLEGLKQRLGRAGRDPDILANGVLLIEKSCFQAQKKSTRKKVKQASAAAIDQADSTPDSVEASGEPLAFPVLLDDDELPAHLQWRKKLGPGLRRYAAAQVPSCRRDVSDVYFGNPARTTVPIGTCCDLCSGEGPFPPNVSRPTTPSPTSAASTPSNTPNKNRKRPRAIPGESDAGPKVRRGDHLTECKAALERWAGRVLDRDWEDGPFTPEMFLSPTLVTFLAYNRFSALPEFLSALQHSTRSWAFAERYGAEVLELLARLDQAEVKRREDIEHEKEMERRLREEERRAGVEQRRAQKQAEIAKRQQAAEAQRQAIAAQRLANQQAQRLASAHAAAERKAKAAERQHEAACSKYINYLNRVSKTGRRPACPPGIATFIADHPDLLTEHGRNCYAANQATVDNSPLIARDLNRPQTDSEPLPFVGVFHLADTLHI